MNKSPKAVIGFFKQSDMLLYLLCCAATFIGFALISSATRTYEDSFRYMFIQVSAFIIGTILFALFTVIDIDIIADKWLPLFIFNVLFILSLFIFGEDDGTGNKAWIRFFGVGLQPTEVVRFTFIVVLAKQLTYLKEYKNLNSPLSLAQLVLHFLIIFGIIVVISGDLGSALVFFFVFIVLLFMSGVKLYWFAIGVALVAGVTPFLWTNVLRDYQKDRIMAPYDPASVDPTGYGITWQTNQSKIALASGQLTGTGLYNGPQSQSSAIPEKHTDFIFAVAGEELGMIGCAIILLLLVFIVVRCVYIGIKSKNTLSMLVCFGIAAVVFFQTFENMGMCMGLTPVVGITLPFLSYGGSSLFSLFAAMGIVSGIKYRPKPQKFRSGG